MPNIKEYYEKLSNKKIKEIHKSYRKCFNNEIIKIQSKNLILKNTLKQLNYENKKLKIIIKNKKLFLTNENEELIELLINKNLNLEKENLELKKIKNEYNLLIKKIDILKNENDCIIS